MNSSGAEKLVPESLKKNFDELYCYALASYAHFKTTWNQICFVTKRFEPEKNRAELKVILEDDIRMAKLANCCQKQNPKVGFEASNHYYYTPNLLMEKVLNCCDLLSKI